MKSETLPLKWEQVVTGVTFEMHLTSRCKWRSVWPDQLCSDHLRWILRPSVNSAIYYMCVTSKLIVTESGSDELLSKPHFKYKPTRPESILEDSGADVTELARTSEQVKAERNPIFFKNTPTKTPLRNGTPNLVCHIEVQHFF